MKLARLTNEKTQEVLMKLIDKPLPAKTAFKLKGVIKRCQEELQKYNEVRTDLLKRHGKKDAEGNLVTGSSGNVEFDQGGIHAFVKDLSEVTDLEVDLPTIKIDDLGSVELTADDLLALDGLIVE